MILSATTEYLIYLLRCAASGKEYVGVTYKPLAVRWKRHIGSARGRARRGALQGAILKYGPDSFEVTELARVIGEEAACKAESELIVARNTLWPNGYNMTTGGEWRGGYRSSDDTKHKMSVAATGRKKSAHTREKISAAALAQWSTPSSRDRALAAMKTRPPKTPEFMEHLRRQAAAMKGKPRKPESVEKGRRSLVGHAVSAETRAKISAANTGKMAALWTPERKARHAQAIARRHAEGAYANAAQPHSPERRAATSRAMLGKKRGPYKLNSATKAVRALLTQLDCVVYPREGA